MISRLILHSSRFTLYLPQKTMYTEYSPSPLLSPYIDKYWEFKGNPEYGMQINILPDGCTDFIFTLGEVAQASGHENLMLQPYRSYFVGAMTRFTTLATYTETVHMLGVRFLPCGLLRFIELPLHELTNQRISTDELNTPFDDLFTEKLCELPHLLARIAFIEKTLIRLLEKNYRIDSQIYQAVQSINLSNGMQSIRSITEQLCICQRHFERKFKQHTGYTPKEYSRIMKFKYAVKLLSNCPADNLLSTAVTAGYYDVPHLSKEIKALSGNTPASFFVLPMPDEITLTYLEA